MTKKEKIAGIAIDTYKAHSKKFNGLHNDWQNLVRRYENELREKSITAETQSKTRLGQAYSLVENFVSRVIADIPRFHYLARERGDVDFVDEYREFNEYQHDEADSKSQYELVAKWGEICGLAGYKMSWKTEQILHKKRGKEVLGKIITNPALVETLDKMHIGKSVKIDDNETVSNWVIDPIAPFDLVWSPEATEREDCNVLGHKIHNKTVQQLDREGYDVKSFKFRLKSDAAYWQEQLEKHKGE